MAPSEIWRWRRADRRETLGVEVGLHVVVLVVLGVDDGPEHVDHAGVVFVLGIEDVHLEQDLGHVHGVVVVRDLRGIHAVEQTRRWRRAPETPHGAIWWMKVATALSSFKNERMFVSMRQSVA